MQDAAERARARNRNRWNKALRKKIQHDREAIHWVPSEAEGATLRPEPGTEGIARRLERLGKKQQKKQQKKGCK